MNKLSKIIENLASPVYTRDYRPLPFWSWNDKLDRDRLLAQIEWMHSVGIGGFFMHARGGLLTEYLGEEWMKCCDACCDKAAELDMDAYMYDENGWPSGFAGGKLLGDENNRDRYLTYDVGDFDEKALASFLISQNSLTRVKSAKKCERCLNVYEHVAVSTVDILNPEVVEKFLDLTHRAYKARYGKKFSQKLKGFFTDEPQYFRWDTPYTPMLLKYFREVYGEDLLDGIGLLFADKDGCEAFRYKYWSAMQKLMLEGFGKRVYDFCESNGMLLTGHYVEESSFGGQMWCCGGAMPFYEYEHIPGIDWLGRGVGGELAVKQVGSAAAQTGRNRILTESFGCCGWDVTPRELKRILDFQYLGGVNVLCQHLLPSSEYGQRKRDYPQHYTPLNPWVKKSFRKFNDAYIRLGALIGHSEEEADVCVMHPVTSAYLDYKRNDDGSIATLEQSFFRETETLVSEHISHHYVDELMLSKMGGVDGKSLVCGKRKYDYVIIPSCKNIASSTLELFDKFVKAGGKLLVMGVAPSFVDGVAKAFPLRSTCSLDDIKAAQPYFIDNPRLRSSMRVLPEGKFVFVINAGATEETFTLTAENAESVRILDTADLSLSEPRPTTLTLPAGQSLLLFPTTEKPVAIKKLRTLEISGAQKVVGTTLNTLMLDSARFAREGEQYGEPAALIKIFSQLLQERYRGKLRLKYEFETRVIPSRLTLYAEDMNTVSLTVNGKTPKKTGALEHEPMVHGYDIANAVRVGKNEIEITLDYYQDDSVYYALFGEGVTESLRNCMVYNTSLESVYLYGDFGVYPVGLRPGQTPRTVLCDSFVIDSQKSEVTRFIEDGFPTLASDITLLGEIDCGDDTAVGLRIGGRWQTASVEINGKKFDYLFSDTVDVSSAVRKGKNEVKLTLTPSLRNLLGPHHFAPCDEPESVSPDHFTSPLFRPSYALVDSFNVKR